MKKHNIILCLLLSVVCAFSIFGLSGCGEVSISTIKDNFKKLNDLYAQNETVFVEEKVSELKSTHEYRIVSFGKKIDNYVATYRGEFHELSTLYNVSFAISNDYVESLQIYIEGLDEKNLTSDARQKLTQFNNDLQDYIKEIPTFLKERDDFIKFFGQIEEQLWEGSGSSGDTSEAYLGRFKKAFGKLIEKNIKLSSSLSEAVEATEIYEIWKKVSHDSNDLGTVKEVARAKMLHIFTDFPISEISNKITWSSKDEGDCKEKIDDLMRKLNLQYSAYKRDFVVKESGYKDSISNDEFSQLFDMMNEFFVEAEAYEKALKEINFELLASTKYKNVLEDYVKENKFAKVYLNKIQQFIDKTLPKFIQEFSSKIYK